jgi:adenosine deaminase
MNMNRADAFIRGLPKAELHVHPEGCLEADMLFDLTACNNIKLRWESPEALRAACRFDNLQSFLDLYFEDGRVLLQSRDLYDLTVAYLRRAMLDAGLVVILNSDDPADFGGSIYDNFIPCRDIQGLSTDDLVMLARNSLAAAFLPTADIAGNVARLEAYVAGFQSGDQT